MTSIEDLADRFHSALLEGDAGTWASILAPDVTFIGPLAEASGAEDCIAGLVRMAKSTTGDEIAVRLTDDENILIWSTMHTAEAPPVQTATWLGIENGKIARIRTVFDPRAVLSRPGS